MKRKSPDRGQKTLEYYMYQPGWTPLHDLQHRAGVMLLYREAGGGGDCMFHSLGAVLGSDFKTIRAKAASAVNAENAPDVLMDMAAQVPASLDVPMSPHSEHQNTGQFSPEALWNESKGSRELMAEGLKKAISTPGNYLWGDATTAALVEDAMGVNIIMLAIDTGAKLPPTQKELQFARAIYGRWVENTFEFRPEMRAVSKERVIATMAADGLTWERAVSLSRMEMGCGPGRWLRGKRQPVGSIRRLCENAVAGNLSTQGYSDDRPTVIIWNRSNVHWVPIAVGPSAVTLIEPGTPLRTFIDDLMK